MADWDPRKCLEVVFQTSFLSQSAFAICKIIALMRLRKNCVSDLNSHGSVTTQAGLLGLAMGATGLRGRRMAATA